jgi:hypothetical protein
MGRRPASAPVAAILASVLATADAVSDDSGGTDHSRGARNGTANDTTAGGSSWT